MASQNNCNVWTEKFYGYVRSYIKLVSLFSDKMMTTLKLTALFAYLVSVILLGVLGARRHWLKDSEQSPVGFLPVYCRNRQLEGDECGRDDKMSIYKYKYL